MVWAMTRFDKRPGVRALMLQSEFIRLPPRPQGLTPPEIRLPPLTWSSKMEVSKKSNDVDFCLSRGTTETPMTLSPMSQAVSEATPARVRPSLFGLAAAMLAAGAAALGWVLTSEVWAKQPEMGDRLLIPLAAGVLVWKRRPHWRATAVSPCHGGLILLIPAAALFAAGWYLLVLVGPRTLLLWWLLAALILATIGVLLTRYGWPRTRTLLFPLVFCFLALPTPDALQKPLQLRLKELTTAGAATVLPWLGVPAEAHGFTLTLPSGELGVVDACSGALSLNALVAISLLIVHVRIDLFGDLSLAGGGALLALTPPIVILSNTVRVIVTGVLKQYVGDWAIRGAWHEALGYVVVLVGFGLIVGTSQLLARAPSAPAAPGPPLRVPPARGGAVAVALLVPALVACLWSEQFRQSYRQEVHLDELSLRLTGWQERIATPDPEVAEMLKCDEILFRRYENDWGQRVDVYVMFWATPASTAHMHHPDICWPSRGWTLDEGNIRPVAYATDRAPLGVSVRHYVRKGKRQVVYYWTQNGRAVLPDGQEPADHTEYAWVRSLLTGGPSLTRTSRLSVLLGTDVDAGRSADQEAKLDRLAAAIAGDVYRLCPWAAPEQ
jgi:EpsI family protein